MPAEAAAISSMSSFTRVDYAQVGLTSKNSLKLIRKLSPQVLELAIGDHSGSLHYFSIRTDTNQIETIFKTLPGPNAKISCLDVYSGLKQGGSAKILIVYGPSMIKGFNKRGKQFFALELNNLTEPIKMFRMHRTPDEIHVLGQYIYNSYLINTELVASGSSTTSKTSSVSTPNTYNSVVRSRHYYVCPAQINDFVWIEDRFNRKIVPVLACQDRLLRVLKDSNCNFEVEVCGIPSVMQIVPKQLQTMTSNNQKSTSTNEWNNLSGWSEDQETLKPPAKNQVMDSDVYICYGTMDGKISLVAFQFMGKDQLEPVHHWEVPVNGVKQPITCLIFSETEPEFYLGRSDGSVEIWRFNESIQEGSLEQSIDLTLPPTMVDQYNCSESITNLLPVLVGERSDLLLLCATFTGLLFGLLQHGHSTQLRQVNPNYLMISRENADRIRSLQEECQKLEKQLEEERKNYAKHTTSSSPFSMSLSDPEQEQDGGNLSVLPFFAINDSFVLHNDASYILMLEVEVAIDVVVLHCDLPLDLIDCERNSAVISFNGPADITGDLETKNDSADAVLVTFRCQSNTQRLEIRLRPVEGQHGTLTVYVVSRITPKSCQTRSYEIQPLSLHKRQYSHTRIEHPNTLTITGEFGLNDAHTWLRLCIPEIPEKLSRTVADVESEVFYYVSTMTKSLLIGNCGRGMMTMTSDNVSTISILKDFITREATKQSMEIGIEVEVIDRSLAVMLMRLYPMIQSLIRKKHRQDLLEALADLRETNEPGLNISQQLLTDLNLDSNHPDDDASDEHLEPVDDKRRNDALVGLDRLYGIITDLFIDYHKLKNSSVITSLVTMAKNKLPEMIEMIETLILDSFDSEPSNSQPTHLQSLIEDDIDLDQEHLMVDDSGEYSPAKQLNDKIKMIKSSSKSAKTLCNTKDTNVQIFIDQLFQFWNITI